jgi:GcrA cell cycle regulator
MSLGWTDERVEVLKKLWVEGLSAAQIANRLGGVTRNAVIGKVHRLGLAGRNAPSQPTRRMPSEPVARSSGPAAARVVAVRQQQAVAAAAVAPVKAIPQKLAPAAAVVATVAPMVSPVRRPQARTAAGLVDVHGLGHSMCKWPIGDPGDPDFGFCGSKCDAGAVYCKEHAAIAYTQPQNQRRDRGEDKVAADLRRLQRSAAI